MTLCFSEVYEARKNSEIGLDEYLHHIVAHYGGSKHGCDNRKWPWIPPGFETEVREIVLSNDFQACSEEDMNILKNAYSCAYRNISETMKQLLNGSTIPKHYFLRPIYQIATHEGHERIYAYCIEKGFELLRWEDETVLARVQAKPSVKWLELLYQNDFRHWRTEPEQLHRWKNAYAIARMGTGCVQWWLRQGGHPASGRGLFLLDYLERETQWPGAATFRMLLDQFGIQWFHGSGTLQLAARKGDLETVTLLVKAGADVNETIAEPKVDVREQQRGPLIALQGAVYSHSRDVIRYLVENGARVKREFIEDPWNDTPKETMIYKQFVAELGGVEEESHL